MKEYWTMLKRGVAMFLAVVMLLTSTNIGIILPAAADEPGNQANPSVTLSELIVSTYDELDEKTVAIISSGELKADKSYSYILPPAEVKDGGLIAVNEESKKVTVSAYKDDLGNLWVPVSFELKAEGVTKETVELKAENNAYVGNYAYDGNMFSIEAKYVLNKEVSAAEQQAMLKAGSLLALDIAKLMLLKEDIIPEKPEGWDDMTLEQQMEDEKVYNTVKKHEALQNFVNSALDKKPGENVVLTPEVVLTLLVMPVLEYEEDGSVSKLSVIQLIQKLGAGIKQEVTGIPEELIEAVEGDLEVLEWDGETLSTELGFTAANKRVIKRLADQQAQYGNLLLGKFLLDHAEESYLEWLMNPETYADLLEAVTGNYADINKLAAEHAALESIMEEMEGLLAEIELIEEAAWDMIRDAAAEYDMEIDDKADLDAMLADFDGVLASQMGPLNDKLPELNQALVDAGFESTGLTKVETKADLESLIAKLESVQTSAESKIELALSTLNADLKNYGYDGEVKEASHLKAVYTWLDGRIAAQNAVIEAALAAANAALKNTDYTGTVNNAADIETAINWLTNNAGDELKAAEAEVQNKLNAVNTLAQGFGYPGTVANSNGVDAVITWLEKEISDDEAELQTYLDTANEYLAQANAQLPADQQYTGTITKADDINTVIDWMNQQVDDAEAALADALATLNAELVANGYTGDEVTKADDIDKVVTWMRQQVANAEAELENQLAAKRAELAGKGYTGALNGSKDIDGIIDWLRAEADKKIAEAQAEINAKLADLNDVLAAYGYKNQVKGSADIDAAVDYMENDAEAYIWKQVNSGLPNGVSVNSKSDVEDAKNKLKAFISFIGQQAYDEAVAGLDKAVEAVDAIPEIVNALNEAKPLLKDAEDTLANAEAEVENYVVQLQEAKVELADVEAQIDEAKAALPGKEAELAEAKAQLKEAEDKIAEAKNLVDTNTADLNSAKNMLKSLEKSIKTAKDALDGQKTQLNAAKAELVAAEEAVKNVDDPSATVIPALREEQSKINAAQMQIDADTAKKQEVKTTYENNLKTAEDALEQVGDAVQQMKDALTAAEEAFATLEQVAESLEAIEETKGTLKSTISMLEILITLLQLFCEKIADINEACVDKTWNAGNVLNAYNESVDYAALTEAATGLVAPTVTVTNPLFITDATVQYNMSMFNVTVKAEAEIVGDNNEYVALEAPKDLVVTLRKDATAEEIQAAIDELKADEAALAHWNGVITTDNYDVSYTELPETLTEDLTYVIKYTPKMLDMTYGTNIEVGDDDLQAQYPYGYKLTLPVHTDANKEWEYVVSGITGKVRQGTVITITAATEISRVEGAASEAVKLTKLIIDTTADLSSAAKAVLESPAMKLNKVIYVRLPNAEMITVAYDKATQTITVNAPAYDSNVAGDWTVTNGVMDGTSVSFQDGVFTTTTNFQEIKVEYQLNVSATAVGLTNAELEEYMNVPYTLASNYKFQKNTLDTLVASLTLDANGDKVAEPLEALSMLRRDYEVPFNGQTLLLGNLLGSLGSLNDSLGMGLSSETIGAASALLKIMPETGNVALYKTLMTYQSEDGGMEHYYKNEQAYIDQINELSGIMNSLTGDATLMGMLGTYKGQFDAINNALNTAASLGEQENRIRTDLIELKSGSLAALLGYLEQYDQMKEYDAPDALRWTLSFPVAGPSSVSYTVKVNVLGVEKTATFVKNVEDNFDHKAEADKLLADNNMIPAGDEAFYAYTFKQDGNTFTYTYGYKVFETVTANISGAQVVVGYNLSLENTTITLPAHENPAEYRWDYTVAGKEYAAGEVELTAAQFKALINGALEITRTEINLEQERLEQEEEEKRKQEQQLISEIGGLGVMTKVGDGQYALVLNLNIDDVQSSLMGFVVSLFTNSYDEILMGGEDFYTPETYGETTTKQIHLQTLINVLLNSGMTNEDLLAMIGADGNIKNSFVLPGEYIETEAYGALGSQMTKTTMTFTNYDDEGNVEKTVTVDFYITLSGNGAQIQSTLESVPADFVLNGGLSLAVGLPEEYYAAYLAALTMVGEADLDNLQAANAEIVIGYLFELLDPVLTDEDVTLGTVENTLAMVGQNVDTSAYESYFNMFKDMYDPNKITYTETGLTMPLENIDISSVINNLQAMVDSMELPGGMKLNLANLIYEYDDPNYADDEYGLDVNVGASFDNLKNTYAALVVDHTAATTSMAKLVSADANGNLKVSGTVVVLLADISGNVSVDATVLDLNGMNVGGNITGNGSTTITDSAYSAAEAAVVSGTVSNVASIVGGKFEKDVSASLVGGYVQAENGVVSNKMFTTTSDGTNVTVTLNMTPSEIRELINTDGMTNLAIEIAASLIVSHYNMAGLSIADYKVFDIQLGNVMELLSSTKLMDMAIDKALASTSASDLTKLLDTLIDDLTNFAAIEKSLSESNAIVSYSTATAVWNLSTNVVNKGAKNDYLAINLGASENKKTGSLSIVVDGTYREELATLAGALAETVTVDVTPVMDDITKNGNVIGVSGSFEGSVVVNFAKDPNYVIMMAVILADNADAKLKADLVSAIEAYYATEDLYSLEKIFDKLTIANICNSLEKHGFNENFASIVNSLNLKATTKTAIKESISNSEMGFDLAIDVIAKALAFLDGRNIGESVTNSGRTLGGVQKRDEDNVKYYGGTTSRATSGNKAVYAGYSADYAFNVENVELKLYLFHDHVCEYVAEVAEDEYLKTAATCVDLAVYYKSCDACGASSKGTEFEATFTAGELADHVYGEPTWTWTKAADGYTVTAKFACTVNGCQHVTEAITAEVELTEHVPATTTSEGKKVYTATVTDPAGKAYTDTHTDVLAKLAENAPTVAITGAVMDGVIYGDLVDGTYLYVDTVVDGLTQAELEEALVVNMTNDADNAVVFQWNVVNSESDKGNDKIGTGSKVTAIAENADGVKATATYTIIILGDTNCNGRLESGDATTMAFHYTDIALLSGDALLAGNVNRKNTEMGINGIDAGDAVIVMMKWMDAYTNYKSALEN